MVGKGQPGTCVRGCWEVLYGEGVSRANYDCLSSVGDHFLPSMPTAGCDSLTGHQPQRGCRRQAGPQHGQKTSPTSSQPSGPQGAVCSSHSLSRGYCTPFRKVFLPPREKHSFLSQLCQSGPCAGHLTLGGYLVYARGGIEAGKTRSLFSGSSWRLRVPEPGHPPPADP